jgi:glycosyltransferase involved in cell wall biosynthesis
MSSMKTVGLAMIVKNEGAVLRRCLESVRPWISHWTICDTGSTDDTREVIREVLKGIPGELHERPWRDFGSNRTEALQWARSKADYTLMMDADETVNVKGEFRDRLEADGCWIRFEGDLDYQLCKLVNNRHDWFYVGVTHEYMWSSQGRKVEPLAELTVTHHQDGGSRTDKYERDIRLLTTEHEHDALNGRTVYYLAQSYRDSGRLDLALQWYDRRARMAGWDQEAWHAAYQAARMMHLLGWDWTLVQAAYLSAYDRRPQRLEPLLHVARRCREMGQPRLGHLYTRRAMEAAYPADILFVERNVYEHELPLEHAWCCMEMGLHEEAVKVNERLLAASGIPSALREIAERNRRRSFTVLERRHTAC